MASDAPLHQGGTRVSTFRRFGVSTFLLDLAYIPAAVAYLPFLLYQMIALGKNRRGWAQRFGAIQPRPGGRPCVWVHAVSLGEVNATASLVDEIHKRLDPCDVVVSATTDTGFAAAVRRYGGENVIRFPLDFSLVVGRVFRRLRPTAVVLMELEVWPNFVAIARRAGVPVGIANGRVTHERSMRRFRLPLIRALARRMFRRIAWVGAQTAEYAALFAELGVPAERIVVTASMKYDTATVADVVPGAGTLARSLDLPQTGALIVAGSTGPGEEEMLLDAFAALREPHPALQLAIVPRKPERFEEVARLIQTRGFRCIRRTACPDPEPGTEESSSAARPTSHIPHPTSPSVVLGDTMGELRKFYALADVVFVGRSLVPLGGSDLMEVAGLGKAMCFGPHVENFADIAEKLRAADAAAAVADPHDLAPTLDRLLREPENSKAMGRRAQDVVRANVGATARTVDLLCAALMTRNT